MHENLPAPSLACESSRALHSCSHHTAASVIMHALSDILLASVESHLTDCWGQCTWQLDHKLQLFARTIIQDVELVLRLLHNIGNFLDEAH